MTLPTAHPPIDLSAAFDSTMTIVRKVEPHDLGKPTPCASWDVAGLINHIVGAARWAAARISGDDALAAPADRDYAAGDYPDAYAESIRVTLAAFAAEGVAQRPVQVPFGEVTGADLQAFATIDQFVHGWDLARALGLDTDLAPEMAAGLLGVARLIVDDALRGPDSRAPFGPEQPAPAGACAADRLAAFLGRRL